MSEEIKEILDKLKADDNYNIDNNDGSAYKELFANEIYILLDYITNLQEEIKIKECQLEEMAMQKTDYTKINILEMKLTNLQEENERLRKQNTEYQDEIFARDNNWWDMQD